jgi:hypothetical protein
VRGPFAPVGKGDFDGALEATGAQQGRVQACGPVGGADQHDEQVPAADAEQQMPPRAQFCPRRTAVITSGVLLACHDSPPSSET